MKKISPIVKTTETSPDMREWMPSSFNNVLREVEHISRSCEGDDPIPLYRGQTDCQWLLDCTLVRTIKKQDFGPEPPYPRPICFHTKLTDVLIRKFGAFWQPSQEAFEKEIMNDIDAWYELMKRFQQYAEEDSEPKGTFLLDWTIELDIALYFATYVGRGATCQIAQSASALWIWDPVPTGNIHQTKKLGELLSMMKSDDFRVAANYPDPLIIHPAKQTCMLRALNQKPIYVSQMDFRYDLAEVWTWMEAQSKSTVFIKVILSESIIPYIAAHLESNGITENRVYPE